MEKTYDWGIDLAKRTTKCRGKKCFYDGNIEKGEPRIRKSFENPNQNYQQQHYMHVDCYLNTTLTMQETTERMTSDSLTEMKGWEELDDDLRKRVEKFFKDWEEGHHDLRWDKKAATEEKKEGGDEGEEEEEEKEGKKRKAKGKASPKKPTKKAKGKSDEEKLEEIEGEESDHVYLENTSDSHNKFYEIWVKGFNVITKYGAIPAYDKTKIHIKAVDSIDAAKMEMEKTIKQKTSANKGYAKASRE